MRFTYSTSPVQSAGLRTRSLYTALAGVPCRICSTLTTAKVKIGSVGARLVAVLEYAPPQYQEESGKGDWWAKQGNILQNRCVAVDDTLYPWPRPL